MKRGPRTKGASGRDATRAVDPELMSPALWIRLKIKGPRTLWLIRKVGAKPTAVAAGVRCDHCSITRGEGPPISVTVHRPEHAVSPSPVLLWFYGGGLISGSAAHVNDVASKFAVDLGAVVVVPDYRVAPEHPYPAAIDDCFATLQWVVEQAGSLGVDSNCIVVGGESAGGGLAAAVAQRAQDTGIALRLQVLMSPMLDDRSVIRAERNRERPLAWTVQSNRFGWTAYLGHAPGEAEDRPYAVPARREDVSDLAPAWMAIGTADLFYDETVEYAERLKAAGVPCELVVMTGAHHGAEYLKPAHPTVQRMADARCAAMRHAIEGT